MYFLPISLLVKASFFSSPTPKTRGFFFAFSVHDWRFVPLGKGSSESPNSTTAPSPKEADAASLCGSMIIPPLNPIYHHTAKEAFF
jgi:hypothetical protein